MSATTNHEFKPAWPRRLSIATAIVFVISSLFPLVAGLTHDTSALPGWWGGADVAVAGTLAVLVLALSATGQSRVNRQVELLSYRGYRVLIHGIFVLLVVLVFCGDALVWAQCLPGFGWRYWLLLYILPAWLGGLQAASSAHQ